MPELQAKVAYAGTPGKIYTELRGEKSWPCVTIEVDLTHASTGTDWIEAPMRDDGRKHRIWIRWGLDDNSWQYTEKKLRTIQFNGDFSHPLVGVPSIVVVGEQNGKYLNFDVHGSGTTDRKPVEDNVTRVLTARYQQNNPKAQAAPPAEQQEAAPSAPEQAPAPTAATPPAPDPSGEPRPVNDSGNAGDIPF